MSFHDMAWPDLTRFARGLSLCLFAGLVPGCTLMPENDVSLDLEAAYGTVAEDVAAAAGATTSGNGDADLLFDDTGTEALTVGLGARLDPDSAALQAEATHFDANDAQWLLVEQLVTTYIDQWFFQ